MAFGDLTDVCRLCLLPLNDSYIDCANDENHEFKDAIKMVYNIDINPVDEYSTKVCLVCCDVLMYNTIHYYRAVEVQKSLSRVQRIKNKLRNFGKKKRDKNVVKESTEKQPLSDGPLIDVEMIEIEPIREPICSKVAPLEDCEMKSIETSDYIKEPPPLYSESETPMFYNLSSFKPIQWPPGNYQIGHLMNRQDAIRFDGTQSGISPKQSEVLESQSKHSPYQNNNVKQSPSLFQMAKNFCGNIMKKHKPNIESGLDDITNQMALLRFST